MTNHFEFESDLAAKTIRIVREFNAPVEKVWRAFTDPDVLEKWFAPKPWKVETKIMDFSIGGVWLYAMVSPEGQKHWTQYEFTAIENGISYSTTGMFSDEDGNTGVGSPKTYREVTFSAIGNDRSKVDTLITFTDEATIKMFVEGGGFKTGTAATMNQLDEWLAQEQDISREFLFAADIAAQTIHIERTFDVPIEKVWKAWTAPALLDKWWGSKPFVTETHSMDFTVGGEWLYSMVSPDGQKYPSKSRFTAIEDVSRFAADTVAGHWDNKFVATGDKTKVTLDIRFQDSETLKMMLEMGFEDGTAASLKQLDELLASN
jgi:uncharacterized protein YndB with AHSA1/START domain